MNKNTAKAIQKRINSYRFGYENHPEACDGREQFDIGHYRYVLHLDNHDLMPYVLRYFHTDYGDGIYGFGYDSNPVHVGNVIDWEFIPADFPERRNNA